MHAETAQNPNRTETPGQGPSSLKGIPERLALVPIRAYQRFVSPWIPACCRFTPSCSEYMASAIMRHGALKGIALGSWRLLRCQPLCRGGWDPVP